MIGIDNYINHFLCDIVEPNIDVFFVGRYDLRLKLGEVCKLSGMFLTLNTGSNS